MSKNSYNHVVHTVLISKVCKLNKSCDRSTDSKYHGKLQVQVVWCEQALSSNVERTIIQSLSFLLLTIPCCYISESYLRFYFIIMIAVINYKTVLPRERKRHTDRGISSTPSAVLYRGGGRYPIPTKGGYPTLGTPPSWPGQRIPHPCQGSTPPQVPPIGPGWGTPLVRPNWGTPPPIWTWSGYPPRCGQTERQTCVKT